MPGERVALADAGGGRDQILVVPKRGGDCSARPGSCINMDETSYLVVQTTT